MQASERVLARRYARALFEVAGGRDAERVREELSAAFKALAPRLEAFRHPLAGAAKLKAALRIRLGGAASEKTLRFLDLLIEKKRFALLPAAAVEYGRLVDEHKGLARAHVRSAGPLTSGEQGTLRARLEQFAGRAVALDVRTDPELLGGVVVRLGDWVLDGSIQGRIKRLARELAGERY